MKLCNLSHKVNVAFISIFFKRNIAGIGQKLTKHLINYWGSYEYIDENFYFYCREVVNKITVRVLARKDNAYLSLTLYI